MSDKGSVFQKGGGGTNFEQLVQTAFLTTLIIRGNAPCITANEIIEVAFQTTNRGYETDDLLIVAKSAVGQHRLLVQIKHNITFTADNDIFKEVIKAFWKDYNNTSIFDKEKDKLLIIKSGFTKEERNHLKSLLNWAKTHATETDFVTEVNRIKGKKDRLEVFRESLKEVNNNTHLSDKEIWQFLKCFDVLEYDFTNQNSVDETYFLNLIKLCKSPETTSNEKEIWDAIFYFVSKLNKDGGSVTADSIQKEELYKNFETKKLSPYFKAIDKLRSDSQAIFLPLKNTIGGFHLDRKSINQAIVDTVNNFQFTIVTGKPGVGKSAEIKDILKDEFSSASIFVFRADQFNKPHIANVFSSQGVNETIQDIFSCISLIPDKIIFIDSLEKLLEADPECAFKQLLGLLKGFPDIKIIGSSRKYAVDLIIQKFGIDNQDIGNAEVLPLDDNELNVISGQFPLLRNVLTNEKIKKLLQSPKYLDFAIIALNKSPDNYANISLTDFKDKLWDLLIVDSTNTKNGLPIKRENAFMEIAVNRAKEMKLFTRPVKADAEAVVLLQNDEIIFQENKKRKYAPAHDILEDWALVRFVSSQYEEYPIAKDFFEHLGNEPAIRRAFRLWVEDYLIEGSSKVDELIRKTLTDISIEKYWSDELLIAVFKSEDCSSFFNSFEKELLENSATFLNRCIHLIRTACKETDNNNSTILLPIGSGWQEMIFFIKNNLPLLNNLRLSIYNLLYDWEYRLLFQFDNGQEVPAVKDIVLHFINQIEQGDEFWEERIIESRKKGLITLLFNLAEVAKEEIIDLVKKASVKKDDRENWKIRKFYETIIETCLSGIQTDRLVKNCPELVIEIMWKEWMLRPREKSNGSSAFLIGSDSLDEDECWGIEKSFSYFPSGIYKMPIYNLLIYHPILALKFICEFINYSVEFYVNAKCRYKHQIKKVQLRLNDGTIINQWAAWELWVAYRSLSVTSYLIESILMSLEKYLMEKAQVKTNINKSNTKFIFDYLLRNSNNVATTGVLASVAIAYPEVVEEQIVPLLSVKEFYEWDSSRRLQENSALAPMDNEISFAQEERYKSNKLPHRTKFFRGLSDFIVEYQFNIRTVNEQIHALFDILHEQKSNANIFWRKKLNEIDVRKWNAKNDADNGRIILQPKYDEEVVKFLESGKEEMEAQNLTMKWSGIIWDAYEGKKNISFETWQEASIYYNNNENLDSLYDRPVSLAVLGLRDFVKVLTHKQKQWCIAKIKKVVSVILDDAMGRHYHLNRSYNLMEKEIALKSFHLLAANVETEVEMEEVLRLIFYTLIAPFSDYEVKENIKYTRLTFFKEFPSEGKVLWVSLIKYAHFRKANPFYYDDHDTGRLSKAKEEENIFIQQCLGSEKQEIDIKDIHLAEYESYLLFRAFLITPFNSQNEMFSQFIKKIVLIITVELQLDEDRYSSRRSRQRKIDRREVVNSEPFLADILLNNDIEFSKEIFTLLLHPIIHNDKSSGFNDNALYEFIKSTLEFIALKILDSGNLNPLPLDYSQQLGKFWKIWQYLFNILKVSDEKPFISTLLFNIRFLLFDYYGKPIEGQWEALENKKEFYYTMVKEVGENHVDTIMNVFSIIGEKAFLPQGLTWIVDLLKKNPTQRITLINTSGERLVKKLFYNHISTIKRDEKLTDDFIWLLNEMVDLGSSSAYLFRENVITYKSAIK